MTTSSKEQPTVATHECGATKMERVKAVREERQCGMYEAKRIVEREDLIADINAAQSIDDIRALLLRIV